MPAWLAPAAPCRAVRPSNCTINQARDKAAVYREVLSILLRPGQEVSEGPAATCRSNRARAVRISKAHLEVPHMQRSLPTLVAVLSSLPLLACGGGSDSSTGGGILGPPTGTLATQCATTALSGLTHANFASGFLGTSSAAPGYCVGCHDSAKAGAARFGAPLDHNFNTLPLLKADPDMLGHIDRVAGANPNGSVVNTVMPPAAAPGGTPALLDRQKLSCWIATGAN